MNHLDLAKQFQKFADDLASEKINVEDKVLLRRIIFSRYYYALFHKYFAIDPELANSTEGQKHKQIKEKLKKTNKKFYNIFIKLQNLRIWADYKPTENKKALKLNLQTLSKDINLIVTK